MDTPALQAPKIVRLVGILAVATAFLDVALSLGITFWSLGQWRDAVEKTGPEAAEAVRICLWIGLGLCLAFSLFSMVTGLSLLAGWRAGRNLAFALLPLALLTALGAQISGAVGKNLAELLMQQWAERQHFLYHQVEVRWLVPLPALAFPLGIAAMAMMMADSAKAWATRRGAWAPAGSDPATLPAERKLCIPALLSLIFAFLPCMMLTQLASIILGIVALVKIRRGQGVLAGRWMAWTGIVVSSLFWLLIAMAVGAAAFFYVARKPAHTPEVEQVMVQPAPADSAPPVSAPAPEPPPGPRPELPPESPTAEPGAGTVDP